MLMGDDRMKARVHSIETFACDDGWDVRFAVFLQGCGAKCIYCANVLTWDFNGGELMDSDDIIEQMVSLKEFYEQGRGGITISGGEPLYQIDFAIDLARKTKLQGLTVALDTSGLINLDVKENHDKVCELLGYVDLVLLDVKAGTDALHQRLCSFKMERTRRFAQLCNELNIPIWVRHVVMKGYNAESDFDLKEIIKFIKTLDNVVEVDLLPFHNMSEALWEQCKINYVMSDDNVPDDEDMVRKYTLVQKELPNVKVTR